MKTELVLYHHGVKGMKWGVRRYQNTDGSLTAKGIKKYAKKGYAQDSLNDNKTATGRAYDRITGAHKIDAGLRYDAASKKANEQRAKQYLKEHDRNRKAGGINRETVLKGAKLAKASLMTNIFLGGATKTIAKTAIKLGKVGLMDEVFFNGQGRQLAKSALVTAGRAAITAVLMARGHTDIKWYDKQDRRVG